MPRPIIVLGVLVLAFAMAAGGYAVAQDQGTPPAGEGTPTDTLCATPVAETTGSPEVVVTAPTTSATPGGDEPGTPIGLLPCPTPVDGTPVTEAEGETEGADSAQEVTVEMIDIAFVQEDLTIPADTDVTFHFVNNGAALHNFKIDDPEVFSGDLASGESSDVVVNLPAGEYEYYCTVPGHKASGMVGTLIVE